MIDRHLSVEQAVLLSRLEEEYQVGFSSHIFSNNQVNIILYNFFSQIETCFLAILSSVIVS